MALHRLTSLTLGVPDVEASAAFFTDFGLTTDDHPDGPDQRWLSTRDGGRQLELVPSGRRRLQRIGVGAHDADDLARVAHRAADLGLGTVVEHTDQQLLLTEPATGVLVEITVAPTYAAAPRPHPFNRPAEVERIDVPAPSVLDTAPVRPSNLTHLVYGTPDQPTTLRFFTEVVGFEVSDEVPGIIAFTRCSEVHHNLAIQAAPVAFAHHIAFEMDDVDDVVRGGQHMVDADPDRHMWGVGRHAIGSNWFWYLREPGGTFIEYTADIDRISAQDHYRPKDWQGHEFLYSFGPPTPAEFLEPADLAELVAAAG
jgi:catechol 2,3-dioxygenase-like lactoylglutathione lyase family enzyme